ncbi:hypothetical protein FRC12_019867 [Ceratobasidium sp. 428]|nr:hypothetical protein FRC12_019867 [Ceratobasidium sp. 428]
MQYKLGAPAVDEGFASMTRAQDLQHFKRGISVVQQWTGREAKEMEKVFLPLLAEHEDVPDDMISFICALLDFSYIARASRLTEIELDELREAHEEMHRLKQVLVRYGIYRSLKRLDHIPKWHMLSHYEESIREYGTPDGYNTEAPEYLHIVYVKRGWEASNKRDVIPQIIDYCQRLEALRIQRAHVNEYYGIELSRGEHATTAVWVADEDGSYEPERRGEEDVRQGEGDEDMGDDEEDDGEEEGLRQATAALDANGVHHPSPEFAIAMRATCHATLPQLIDDYGATSLERALKAFLRPYAEGRWFILASNNSMSGINLLFTTTRCPSPPTSHDNAT